MQRVVVPAGLVWACFTLGMLFVFVLLMVIFWDTDSVWAVLITVAAFLGAVVGTGFATITGLNETKYTLIRPKTDKLQKRLQRVQGARWDVQYRVHQLPEGSPHRTNLESRLHQLETTEELLKVEMTYEALGALDKRATRLIRKELER